MKVHELIKKLNKFDQKLDVICYIDDEQESIPLAIESVDLHDAETIRNHDQRVLLNFEKSSNSKQYVIISVTSDF